MALESNSQPIYSFSSFFFSPATVFGAVLIRPPPEVVAKMSSSKRAQNSASKRASSFIYHFLADRWLESNPFSLKFYFNFLFIQSKCARLAWRVGCAASTPPHCSIFWVYIKQVDMPCTSCALHIMKFIRILSYPPADCVDISMLLAALLFFPFAVYLWMLCGQLFYFFLVYISCLHSLFFFFMFPFFTYFMFFFRASSAAPAVLSCSLVASVLSLLGWPTPPPNCSSEQCRKLDQSGKCHCLLGAYMNLNLVSLRGGMLSFPFFWAHHDRIIMGFGNISPWHWYRVDLPKMSLSRKSTENDTSSFRSSDLPTAGGVQKWEGNVFPFRGRQRVLIKSSSSRQGGMDRVWKFGQQPISVGDQRSRDMQKQPGSRLQCLRFAARGPVPDFDATRWCMIPRGQITPSASFCQLHWVMACAGLGKFFRVAPSSAFKFWYFFNLVRSTSNHKFALEATCWSSSIWVVARSACSGLFVLCPALYS